MPVVAAVAATVLVAVSGCVFRDEVCLVQCQPAPHPGPSDEAPWFAASWFQDIADGDLAGAWDKLSAEARQEYGDSPDRFASAAPELLADAGETATVTASWYSTREVTLAGGVELVLVVLPEFGDESGAGVRLRAAATVVAEQDSYSIGPAPAAGELQFASPEPGSPAPAIGEELVVRFTGLVPDDETLRFMAIAADETYSWPDVSVAGDRYLLAHVADATLIVAAAAAGSNWHYTVLELTPDPSA